MIVSDADWSDSEVGAIVADYFEMLSKELRGEQYVKANRNRALRQTVDRTKGSVEMKHCNISAVLKSMDLSYIHGYKPRKNLQRALRAAVERHIDTTDFFARHSAKPAVNVPALGDTSHRAALLRRRAKMVVEHGPIARLFKKGTHGRFQEMLCEHVNPEQLAHIRSESEYDEWLADTVLQPCWAVCSRNGLKTDRWAYVAKVLNILVYEVCSNRELVDDKTWRRLQQWLHLPLDSKVFKGFAQCVPAFAVPERLKGLSQREYFSIQRSMRAWARSQSVPPIWLEDYYSSA